MDGSQSGGAAAAQKAKEYGFGLIGARMSQRDPRSESTLQVPLEAGKTPVASGLLQIPARVGKIQIVERKRKIERRRETSDKLNIAARRIAPKIVVDVQHA